MVATIVADVFVMTAGVYTKRNLIATSRKNVKPLLAT